MFRRLCCLGVLVSIGCSRIDTIELPAYPVAMAMPGLERPKLVYDNQVAWGSFPTLIPYALLTAQRGAGVHESRVVRTLWHKGGDLKADVVRIIRYGYGPDDPAIKEFGASLTDHWQKIVAPQYGMLALCMRRANVEARFSTNEIGVLELTPELKKAGLQKWDRLIAINDVPLNSADRLRSRHFTELLKAQVGDDVRLTWERPGAGVMEARVTCDVNGETPPVVAPIEWEKPTPEWQAKKWSDPW